MELKPNKENICGRSYHLLNAKLTNDCNGRCEFCIASGTYKAPKTSLNKMIEATIALSQFQDVDVLGGEPTLYKDLYPFLEAIRPKKSGKITIITNGSNIDVLIKCKKFLDTIIMSIHHYDLNKNKDIVGILVNENRLKQLNREKGNTETILACVICKENLSTMNDIRILAKQAKEWGFDAIKLMEVVTMNEGYKGFVDLQDLLLPYGIHQKNPTLKGCLFELDELGRHLGIKTYIKLCCPFNNIYKAKDYGVPNNIEYQHDYINVIHPDGTVTDSWVYTSYENQVLNGKDVYINYEEEKL
ncbi:MAG: radical SAM protein [Clostridia bacterium]